MIKTSQKFIEANKWFFKRGKPTSKYLHEWIFKLDLDRINFVLKSPIDICNFVIMHTRYTPDEVVYGVKEYWLQNEEEMYALLKNRKDDCDGVAMLTASLLHSVGNTDIHLALGYYGNPKYALFCNHAYCVLMNHDDPNDPYVLDTVGYDNIDKLPKLSELPNYTTLVSCNAKGEYYLYDIWENKYNGIS